MYERSAEIFESRTTAAFDESASLLGAEFEEELPYNAETIAAIAEGDAIVRGEIPSPVFHSIEELLADLRS